MSPYTRPAPRGFRWADAPVGRAIVTTLAVFSLALSIFVGYKYVGLIDCLQTHAAADAVRTRAIADATDNERAADLALLEGLGSRADAIEARKHTDDVRAANPAPSGNSASCR